MCWQIRTHICTFALSLILKSSWNSSWYSVVTAKRDLLNVTHRKTISIPIICWKINTEFIVGSSHCILANVRLGVIVVKEFEFQSRWYLRFRINILKRSMSTLIPTPSNGLNNTSIVLLKEWLWHYITREGWYIIKQRNQIKPKKLRSIFSQK